MTIRWPPQAIQLGAAIAVLVIGVLIYLLDRSASGAWLIPQWWSAAYDRPPVFGRLGEHLPTFIHVYSFILITAMVLAPWKRAPVFICLLWFAVDSLFELAQIDVAAAYIGSHIPAWFAAWPLLNNVADYFAAGRFDPYDLVSIGLGTVAAYLTVRYALRRGENSC
jgi:hypothetical protein